MSNQERISLREYGRRIGTSDTAVRKAIKAEKIIKGVVYDEAGKPWIVPEIANSEWAKSYDPGYERVTKSGAQAPVANAEYAHPTNNEHHSESKTVDTSLASARRAQAVFKAKILELEMKEKQGVLVDREQVYKALFVAGQEVRSALQAVPDRMIDSILAARSRNEAHKLLADAIADALEQLAGLDTRDLTKR